jgi:hypothetical protein
LSSLLLKNNLLILKIFQEGDLDPERLQKAAFKLSQKPPIRSKSSNEEWTSLPLTNDREGSYLGKFQKAIFFYLKVNSNEKV